MSKEFLAAFRDRIDRAEKIMVTAHIRPDGDAIGSILSLGLALREAGKQVEMVSKDGVPDDFKFLEGAADIKSKSEGGVDMVIALDSGDITRVEAALNGSLNVDVNIDHHISNPGYGELNFVDAKAVSTTEILSELIPGAGLPVTASVAEALLFGILTDSQGFMTLNTTANSLRAAAALVEQGADMNNLYYQVLAKKSYEAVKYWGAGLASLKREDGIAWTVLSIEDRQQANYPGRDDANLVNLLSRIDGVGVAIVFIEQDNEKVKVSWRAKKGFNVSEVAASFGGGGHVAAAGATIEGKLEEVQERVLSATKTAIF